MHNPIIISLILTGVLLPYLNANEIHTHGEHSHHFHGAESTEYMIAYQLGYAEIHSKNNHMPDDSGAFLGIHLMKHIDSSTFNDNLFLAAGAHTTVTDNQHIGVMLGIMYQINNKAMLSIMPGLMFMKHEVAHSTMGMGHGPMNSSMNATNSEWETEEAIHIELSHTINLFNRELNPSLGWMSSSSHDQYSLGLNFHF